MINVTQITRKLSMLPDGELKNFAEMHKQDPYTFSLAISESVRRKDLRSAPRPEEQQPTVADQQLSAMEELPEDVGIAALPMSMNLASGGIVAFDDGGDVYSNEGRNAKADYREYALAKAKENGVDPVLVDSIFNIESGYRADAQSPTGPQGIGQLTKATGKAYGVNPEDRKDPYKNIDASIAFMADLNKKYAGDPSKIAIAYNQGETVLNKHLRANKGELNASALPTEAQGYLKKLQKFAFKLAPGSTAQAEALPVDQPPAKQAAQADGSEDLINKEIAATAATGLGYYPAKAAYNALQDKIKIADAARVTQGTAAETAMAERAAKNAALPRLAGPSGGGVTQATDRIAAEKLAQEAARRQALITSGEMAGKFGPRAAISGLGNLGKLALTNPAVQGIGAIGYGLGKAQQGVMASPGGSQLKEALYENPMLGAMDPDAAFGAAIMDAPRIAEKQQQQLNPAARVDDRTKRDPANYRTPSTATQDDRTPRDPANYDIKDLTKKDKKEIVDEAKDAVPASAKTKGFTNDDWLQFGLALMAGKSQYAFENIGNAGLSAVAGKKEREKEERAIASKMMDKTDMTKVIDRLMKDDPELSYKDAYEIFRQGQTNSDLIARGLATKEQIADNLANEKYQKAVTDLEKSVVGITGRSPTATPAQKQAYMDALAKIPKPVLSSGQQVAPAASTMPPLPGAKIVGSRPA